MPGDCWQQQFRANSIDHSTLDMSTCGAVLCIWPALRARSAFVRCPGASIGAQGTPDMQQDQSVATAPKRRPGRPRKQPAQQVGGLAGQGMQHASAGDAGDAGGDASGAAPPSAGTAGTAAGTAPKKRGRPRKHPLPDASTTTKQKPAKKPVGRPPGAITVMRCTFPHPGVRDSWCMH
jgi:hypothetical protein